MNKNKWVVIWGDGTMIDISRADRIEYQYSYSYNVVAFFGSHEEWLYSAKDLKEAEKIMTMIKEFLASSDAVLLDLRAVMEERNRKAFETTVRIADESVAEVEEWEREKEDEKPLKIEVLMDSYAEKIAEAREERHESEKVNVYVSTVVMAYGKALERLLKELKELFTRVDKASMDATRIQSDYSAIFHMTDDYQNDLLDNAICGLNQAAENLEQLIGWRENGG